MLATLAALQLLLSTQTSPPGGTAEAPGSAEAAPLPRKERAPSPTKGGPRQVSLLSAEPLGGQSASLFWAGWSSFGALWAQGFTERDDLGALGDFDWEKTELRLGGFYRRPLGTAGSFDVAGRLGVLWYQSFGSSWIRDGNRRDRGIELAPGASFSMRGRGIFSAIAEAPLTITFRGDGGLLFSPRFSVAYEAPLYPELSVGARLGVGYRAGSGDAPLQKGRGELLFLVLLGYQL